MKKQTSHLNFLIFLFALILLYSCNCGNNNSVPTVQPISTEFELWKSSLPKIENLQNYWNTEEKPHWTFVNFSGSGYNSSNPVISWTDHKNDSPQTIWKNKWLNCHFSTVLFQSIYHGTYLYITQTGGWNDAILLTLQGDSYWIISCSGVILRVTNLNTNDFEVALAKIRLLPGVVQVQMGLPEELQKFYIK